MPKFEVGQKVLVTSVNGRKNGPVERTVVKVGRLNVTLDAGYFGWREKAFRMSDGGETGDYSHERVWTEQEYAERDDREQLRAAIKEFGFENWSARFDRIPTDKLRRIVAILNET